MKVSSQKIKKKIKFLNNFQKITKSVSLISAVRFQKKLTVVRRIIPNIFYFLNIFYSIIEKYPEETKMIFEKKVNEKGKNLIIVVSSDRGLSGSFDQLIFKKTRDLIDSELNNENFLLGIIGQKGVNYFKKLYQLEFFFYKFENFLPENLARELFNYINVLLNRGKIKNIYFVRSNLTFSGFIVESLKIFPYDIKTIEELIDKIIPKMKEWEKLKFESPIKKNLTDYIFEPNIRLTLNVLLRNLFFLILYTLILESQAALELTRTITMKRANENAKKIKNKTILEYNKLRQEKITEELIDLLR
ncbi:MAG: ATP synthase gamma chain [Candidatus Parcubacteria bacterium]|nr:MAG: ATP synthase gamma chain [Candidatus Parcubacteria bacterium]